MIGWEIVEIVVIGFLQMSRREGIDGLSASVEDEKYNFQFGQIHLAILTNIFSN